LRIRLVGPRDGRRSFRTLPRRCQRQRPARRGPGDRFLPQRGLGPARQGGGPGRLRGPGGDRHGRRPPRLPPRSRPGGPARGRGPGAKGARGTRLRLDSETRRLTGGMAVVKPGFDGLNGDSARMTVHPRRAREIARTRQDILEAAARAFARNGYQAVTMQEIAREAGYTAASLYSYFSSKAEILTGLAELVLHEIQSVFDQPIPANIPLREKLLFLFERQLELARKRKEIAGLVHMGVVATGDHSDLHRERVDLLAEFLRDHARPGELGGVPPEDVAMMLNGLGATYFLEWLHREDDVWLKEKFTQALDVILRGLRSPG